MNGTKMSKNFFFKMIEQRLNTLEKEVEEMKAEKEMSFEARIAKENILFGRLIELNSINSYAMDVDYWKYIELDERIRTVRESI